MVDLMPDNPFLAHILRKIGNDLPMQIPNNASVTTQTSKKLVTLANCGVKTELVKAKKKEFWSLTPLKCFSRMVNAHVLSLHSQ